MIIKTAKTKLRSEATSLFDVRCSMFDPPEADKCLLAFGELGVHPLKRVHYG
jgi:hypothetical protein